MTENEAKVEIMESGIKLGAGDYVDVEALKVAVNALEEIQQYREIGTVEEFKALKEKNTPKKVVYQGEHEKCPSCGSFHVFGNYCTECGQKIDWGKGE